MSTCINLIRDKINSNELDTITSIQPNVENIFTIGRRELKVFSFDGGRNETSQYILNLSTIDGYSAVSLTVNVYYYNVNTDIIVDLGSVPVNEILSNFEKIVNPGLHFICFNNTGIGLNVNFKAVFTPATSLPCNFYSGESLSAVLYPWIDYNPFINFSFGSNLECILLDSPKIIATCDESVIINISIFSGNYLEKIRLDEVPVGHALSLDFYIGENLLTVAETYPLKIKNNSPLFITDFFEGLHFKGFLSKEKNHLALMAAGCEKLEACLTTKLPICFSGIFQEGIEAETEITEAFPVFFEFYFYDSQFSSISVSTQMAFLIDIFSNLGIYANLTPRPPIRFQPKILSGQNLSIKTFFTPGFMPRGYSGSTLSAKLITRGPIRFEVEYTLGESIETMLYGDGFFSFFDFHEGSLLQWDVIFPGLGRECDEDVIVEIIEGYLPTGVFMTTNGVIYGTLPNLDCEDHTKHLSPAFNWFGKNTLKEWHAWGVSYRFKVRAYVEGNPQAISEKWLAIRVYNDWDYDRDNFMEKVVSNIEYNLDIKSLQQDSFIDNINNRIYQPFPNVTEQLILLPKSGSILAYNVVALYSDYKNNSLIFSSQEEETFFKELEKSIIFRRLLIKSEIIEGMEQEIEELKDTKVEVFDDLPYLRIRQEKTIEGRYTDDNDYQLIELNRKLNSNLPLEFKAYSGEIFQI